MIRGFDVETYQRRIDERVGLSRDGKSILKLSYAPQVWTWALGEYVPRYWTKRRWEDGQWKYEQPDRFVFEKRVESEAYWDAHLANRYQVIDATGEVVDLGLPPEDYYVYDSMIAVHSGFHGETGEPECCERAWRGEVKYQINSRLELVEVEEGGRQKCWGEYREPNDSDLARVERAVREMNEDKFYDPYAPLSAEQLAAIEIEANLDTQRMVDERKKRLQENSDDFLHSYAWRLKETSAKSLSHGRYHFLGKTWAAGKHGLAVPV